MIAADANTDDFGRLIAMARQFYAASGYSEIADFNEPTLLTLFGYLVTSEDGFLMATDNGMLAGLSFPIFFDGDSILTQELMWWVDPEGRAAGEGAILLDAFESWSRSRGAKATIMLNLETLDPDGLAKVYARRGYAKAEQNWMRVN